MIWYGKIFFQVSQKLLHTLITFMPYFLQFLSDLLTKFYLEVEKFLSGESCLCMSVP